MFPEWIEEVNTGLVGLVVPSTPPLERQPYDSDLATFIVDDSGSARGEGLNSGDKLTENVTFSHSSFGHSPAGQRGSLRFLPHLSIPHNGPPNIEGYLNAPPTPATPATPLSPNSPITGVIDLTNSIKTIDESPITTGGFSDIYKGIWMGERDDTGGQRGGNRRNATQVAIKLLRIFAIRDQDCVKARRRLNREVYVWHRLEHPNIAELFGTSYHMNGRPSMIMRWYQHGSATEYLRGRGSEVDREALVLDVARGLSYLHTLVPNPIVHGDLKGNNVLIADDGTAVLSDFGLSQVIEDLMRPTGYTPSKPETGPLRWQAPELIDDELCQPTLETDVWSFACTAYELLTGYIPYQHRVRDSMVIRDMQNGIKPAGQQPNSSASCQINLTLKNLLYDSCWSFEPSQRLTMVDIVSQITSICVDGTRHHGCYKAQFIGHD